MLRHKINQNFIGCNFQDKLCDNGGLGAKISALLHKAEYQQSAATRNTTAIVFWLQKQKNKQICPYTYS